MQSGDCNIKLFLIVPRKHFEVTFLIESNSFLRSAFVFVFTKLQQKLSSSSSLLLHSVDMVQTLITEDLITRLRVQERERERERESLLTV